MSNENDPGPVQVDGTSKKKSPLKRLVEGFAVSARKQPQKKRLIIVGVASLVVLGGGVGALQAFGPTAPEPDPVPEVVSNYVATPPEPTTVASRLTGVQVEPELDNRPVTSIMIENSIDARPQSGLKDAGVVFEAIAEGGITRFLVLFQTEQPDYIGPVRSARPYYVRWAKGFDASYVHSGGSGEALALIQALGMKDMDHGRYSGSFDRISGRYAPHNVYTSMARLDSLRNQLGYGGSNFSGFERIEPVEDNTEEDTPSESTTERANTISFDISGSNYNTSYTYDPTTNTYARFMAGIAHTDERSGEQIRPTVVIALEMTYGIHSDGVHSVYGNIGSGDVTVFQNGEVIKGTWEKPSDGAELKFKLPSGEPLRLQPGQTWITAIHNSRYSYTPQT